jgi:ankyrin repeat protein
MSSDYIDVQNHQGQSALHCASYFANVEAVRLLLKASANPDIGDAKGKTPLHFCAGNTQSDAVLTSEVLLEKGSSSLIDWQDHEGRTALHVAVKAANKYVASLLIGKRIRFLDSSNFETILFSQPKSFHSEKMSRQSGRQPESDSSSLGSAARSRRLYSGAD